MSNQAQVQMIRELMVGRDERIYLTTGGKVGMEFCGVGCEMSVEDWVSRARMFEKYQRVQRALFEFKEALEGSHR